MNTSARVLIIHGWGSNSREHWFLEKKARLEAKGFQVLAPDMPDTKNPKQDEWVKIIEQFKPDEDSVLIGHSLGGTAILRYLEKANQKVGQSILVATPIEKLGINAIDDFFEPDFNWARIKANCSKFVIFNQTNDSWVPLSHGQDLAQHTAGELVVIEGANHFDTIDSQLLEKYILEK